MSKKIERSIRDDISDQLSVFGSDAEQVQDKFDEAQRIFEKRFNSSEGTNIPFSWLDEASDDTNSESVVKKAIVFANTPFLRKYGHWGASGYGLEHYYFITDVAHGKGDSRPLANKYPNAQLIKGQSYFLIKI